MLFISLGAIYLYNVYNSPLVAEIEEKDTSAQHLRR
jgi:hypothetical protein